MSCTNEFGAMMHAHFAEFNSHLWYSALFLLVFVAIPAYLGAFFSLGKDPYAFDPRHRTSPADESRGTFKEHFDRYSDLAKLLVTLSGAVIAFLIGILTREEKSSIANALRPPVPIIIGFFGCSMVALIAFMAAMSFWYEQYCHSIEHNTYTRGKYATVISLGVTGVSAFLLGVVWLSESLFG